MAGRQLRVDEVRDHKDLMTFIRLPWNLYRGNPCWVPPLLKDLLSKFSLDHPFRSHSKMALFLAREEERVRGRAAGIIDDHYLAFHQEKTGFFGFFESENDPEVARALLSSVEEWLRHHGMEKMIGPMNPSINDECGLLVDGYDAPPTIMMPYNHPYYPALLEGVGLQKAMDLYAYALDESHFVHDRLERVTERIKRKEPTLQVRSLNLRRFEEDLQAIKEIYNNAWSQNWGFVPLTEAEIDDLARHLKPLVVPDLVLLAYLDGEPVAFSVALPDYNLVLKHLHGKLGLLGFFKFLYYSRKMNTVRVMLLGVKQSFQKRGIEGLLYLESLKRGVKKNYRRAECSWILETNLLMRHGLEAMGGKHTKTYRLYEKPLQRED